MPADRIKCINCNSVQVEPKDSHPRRGIKFTCKSCKAWWWRVVELPPELMKKASDDTKLKIKAHTDGKAAAVKAKAAKEKGKAGGGKAKATQGECDGSTALRNVKHESFVQKVFSAGENPNQAEAYILSGYKPKDANSAKAAASKLLTVDNVKVRLAWLQDQVATDNIVSRTELLELYSKHVRADLHYALSLDPVTGLVLVAVPSGIPGKSDTLVPFEELKVSDIKSLEDVRMKAMEAIRKMQGFDKPDKIIVGVDGLDKVFEVAAEEGLGIGKEGK